MAFGLRRVAAELAQDHLARHEYTETRERLVADDKRRFGEAGVLAEALPTLNQIDHFIASLRRAQGATVNSDSKRWEKALDIGGLKRPPPPTKSERHRTPIAKGFPIPVMMFHFVQANGRWPSFPTLLEFAKACDRAMTGKERGVSMETYRVEATELLEQVGIPVPTPPKRGRGQPERGFKLPDKPLPEGTPYGQKAQRLVSRERCLEAMLAFLSDPEVPPKRGVREYQEWRRGTDWPSPEAFRSEYGGFQALKDEALAILAAERRGKAIERPDDDDLPF